MNLFSTNSKLKKEYPVIYKFSLPMGLTCPAAAECRSWCYMRSVYRLRGAVCINAHIRNYELSKKACFPAVAIHELKSRPYITRLRWHDSGDIYSQGYLNRLIKIFEATADLGVFHYFYTKSLHLNYKRLKLLKNVKMIQSEGGKYRIDKRSAHAVVIGSGDPVPVGYVNGSGSDMAAIKHNKIYLYLKGGKKC